MKNLNNKTKKQLIECIETLQKQIKKLEKDKSESQNLVGELKDSEGRQRTIFQSTGTAMVIVEKDKILSMANLQFEKLCGYSRKEVEGKKTWTEFIVKDDLKRMKEYHRLRRISEDLSPTNYEFRFIDRKGHIKNIFLNIAMIPGTKKSVASLLDITKLKNIEKALRESEARWKALSENLPALIILQDRDGKVLFINRSVSDQSKKKVVGKSIYNFIPPGFHKIASDCFTKVWKTRKQCSYSTQLKTAESKVRHFDVWVNPVFEKEEIVAIVSSSFDVSEKKLMEKVLQESKERLSLAIEGARLGLWDYNFKTGEISRNEYWAEMLGYTLREIENNIRGFYKLIHPDDRAKTEEKMQEHEEGKSPDIDVEHRMLNKEGQWKWIRNWGRIVDRDNNGKPLRALGMHFDITARKQIEEEIKKYRDHLEELVKERTTKLEEQNKELERFNNLFVKREFRIKELRDRVKELEKREKGLSNK